MVAFLALRAKLKLVCYAEMGKHWCSPELLQETGGGTGNIDLSIDLAGRYGLWFSPIMRKQFGNAVQNETHSSDLL